MFSRPAVICRLLSRPCWSPVTPPSPRQTGVRPGALPARLAGRVDEAEGAEEATGALPEAEPEPGGGRTETADGAAGQTALPEHHQPPAQLRRQVLQHQHRGTSRVFVVAL